MRSFLPGAPDRLDSFRETLAGVQSRFDVDGRSRAAGFIRPPTGADPARLERWIGQGGGVVTTGQQPGLFGGPLYSLYKGLTAIRLARSLEDRLRVPILPVFWVASEDHDWDEVGHTWLLDPENELRKVEVAQTPREREHPIHRVHPGDRLTQALGSFLDLLPPTEFKPDLEALLRLAYPADASLADGFHRLIDAVLGPMGIYRVDAADPKLKTASRPVLEREVERWQEHQALLTDRATALEAAGYHVQAPILPGGVNVFIEGEVGRERLYADDGTFHLRHSGTRLTPGEIRDLLEGEPCRMSPNVLLRPVVESHVMPVVSYVAGPGETAYWAQLEPLFRAHDLRLPVVHPRIGVTVLESKVQKVLDKFGLEPDGLARPHHELAGEVLREEMPEGIRRAMGELKGTVAKGVSRLGDEVRGVDPTLRGPVDQIRTQAFHAIEEVERKLVQAMKRENEIGMSQLEKARMNLFPSGKPQERVLNPAYYLARYGQGFVRWVFEGMELPLDASGSVARVPEPPLP